MGKVLSRRTRWLQKKIEISMGLERIKSKVSLGHPRYHGQACQVT